MSQPSKPLIIKADSAILQTLEPGQKAKIAAQAATRYRVLRAGQADKADKADEADKGAQAEALAAQVLASRHGDDLRLDYADGSQLQLEGFFQVCQGTQGSACAVELPATGGGTQLLSGDSASGAASAGQGYALYAYGASSEMAGLLQAQGLNTEGLKGLSQDGDQISYLPPADGFNWAWLAPLAALPLLSSAASPVPTVIKGSVVAGPVLANNGLVATAYKADGSVLASGAVNADGSFTLTVGNDYQGPVLIRVSDSSDAADYFDEASGAAKDLGPDLRALAVVPAPGTYTISVNALTELAVRQLGLEGGDNGASAHSFGGLSAAQIQAANQQVAAAVGLQQDLVLGAPAVAIVTTGGESNAQANDYGRLLAAISGAEVGSSTEQVLQTLTQSLTPNATAGEVLEVLLDGAAKAQVAGLVDAVSDITSQKSAQVTIDPVAGDNRLGADEMAAGVTVSGTAAANASVTIEWSDVSGGGQPTGTRSVSADAQGHWSVTFGASEMPALGATSLKASVGSAVATRSIYLDEPAAPTLKLHADSGSSASDGLTNDARVDVSGYVDGWDYSTDAGKTWNPGQGSSFQVSGDGAQNVQVRQNVGGHYSEPASLGFTLDTLAPTVAVGSDKTALKIGETATITFTLSEASGEFTVDDVVVSGGKLSGFSGSGKSYSATFTPTEDSTTAASIRVASDKFADAAGNLNADGADTDNAVSMSVDTVRPTIAISSDKSALKAGETATITFTLSEASSDFKAEDLTVTGGTLSTLTQSGTDSKVYSAIFTPKTDSTTAASISVASDKFSDVAGNHNADGSDANNTVVISIDTVRPTVEVSSDKSALKIDETATITFTLSEASTDFTADDVVVSGGKLSGFTGSGTSYSATFTPTADSNAEASIGVVSGKFSDAAGNQNADGADTDNAVSMSVDTVRPTIVVSSDKTELKAGETATITFTLSEASTNFTAEDLTVTGGTLGTLTQSGTDSKVYSATFTPTKDSTTAASISVASDKFSDVAGNHNADGSDANNTVVISIDTLRPTIEIDSDKSALKIGETVIITFTLSEASSDFTVDDVVVSGGKLTGFSGSGKSYSATFTPTEDSTTAASISVASDKFADAAGNHNADGSDANNTVAISIDTVRPTVEVTSDKTALKVGETATITFTLNESSSDFSEADITFSGGTLSDFKGSGTSYSATFTPTEDSTTAASISVASDKFADAAGNLNADGADTNNNVSIKVDTVAPSVASVELSDLELKVGDTAKLTVTFSEKVQDFAASDVTVEAGSLGEFTSQDGGLTWTATLTPTAGQTLDKSKITVGTGYTDLAGNTGAGGEYAGPAVDTLAPTVLSIKLSDEALKKGETASVTVKFSEAVEDFSSADMLAGNGSLGSFTSTDGITWTATFTPTDDIESATNVLKIADSSYSDAAGNSGGEGSSGNYAIDTLLAQSAQGAPFVTPLGADGSWVVTRYSVGSLEEFFSNGFPPMDATLEIHRPDGSMLDPVHIEGIAPSNLWAAMIAGEGAQVISSIFPSPVTALADGGFLVTSGNLETMSWQVRRYDAAGKMVGAVMDFPASYVHPQTVAVGDGYVVAYQVMHSDSSPSIELQWFNGQGVGAAPVAVQASDDAYGMTLVADPAGDGKVYIGWTELGSSQATSDNKTHVVSCQPTGTQSAIDTSSTISAGPLPSLLPVSDGSLVRAWSEDSQSASDSDKTYLTTDKFHEQIANVVPGSVKLLALNDQDSVNGATGSFVFSAVRKIGTKSELVLMTLDAQAESLQEASIVKTIDLSTPGSSGSGTVNWYLSNIGSSGDYLLACQTKAGVTVSRFNLSGTEVSSTQLPPDANYYLTGLVTTDEGYVLTGINKTDSDGSVMRFDAEGRLQAGPDTVVAGGAPLALFGSESGTYYLVHDSVTVKTLADITGAADGKWNAQTLAQVKTVTGYSLSTDGLVDGSYKIYAQDEAGNFGLASTRSYRVDVDLPVVELSLDKTSVKQGETAQLTLQLSEAVAGLDTGDLVVTGGKISDLVQDSGNRLRYSATFTPDADHQGQAKVELAAGLVSDLVGHVNVQSQVELEVDTLRPTIAISSDQAELKAGETATITFTLSEASSDFSEADITFSGGTLSNFQGSGTSYSATFTPTADSTTAASISVASNKFSDAAGNQNADGTDDDNAVVIRVDTLAPSAPGLSLESDTGFSASDGLTSNGLLNVTGLEAGASWQYSLDGGTKWVDGSGTTIAASALGADGDHMVMVQQTDKAGNVSEVQSLSFTLDSSKPATPTAKLTTDSSNGGTGFDADGITSSGALTAPSNVETDAKVEYRVKGPGDIEFGDWSASYTAPSTDGKADGDYQVEVHQIDKAGNISASQSINYTLDSKAPAKPDAALTAAKDDGGAIDAPTNLETGATLEYRLSKDGVHVNSDNDGWSSDYLPPATDGSADGAYTLELRQTDAAGNVSEAQSLSFGIGSAAYAPIELSDIAAGTGGFVINGSVNGKASGWSVSNAGDVNGDGLADLIVGAPNDPEMGTGDGRSYVVFGRTENDPVELSALAASQGFVINGEGWGDVSGWSVSSAGDVNGDGLADLIVGAANADQSAGRSYVVFGQTASTEVNLSAVSAGSGGFVINGQCSSDQSGFSVSGAGDVNGDGLSDLIVGAFGAKGAAGSSYVVFGRSGMGSVELSALGSNGFIINGQCANDHSGANVSSAGDVNGDGLADLIVGADAANGNAGQSYVVFGRSGTNAVELSAVVAGSGGFVINGGLPKDNSGWSVSGAGDVNGDGLADLVIGAPVSKGAAGRSYVVFGSTAGTAVALSALVASQGFVINGQCANDMSGNSVSSAGDVNGDGLADLIVGASNANAATGRSYVVYGRSGTGVVELSAVAAGSGGFVINGQCALDLSGNSVSGAGDVNGDGLADLIVGAPYANGWSGRSYVIFGATGGAFGPTAVDQLGTSGADMLSDDSVAKTLVAGAGDDSLAAFAASVLHGGAGNDQFYIDSGMITALQSPLGRGGNDGQLARIDGGSGLDTIALLGSGLTLDLTQVAHQAVGNPDGGSRISSIERIDLGGLGNQLKLVASDIFDLAGLNSYNGAKGWTGLEPGVSRHQLLVDGSTGDKLSADGLWKDLGPVSHDGQTYRRLVQGNAELLVDADITLDLTVDTVPTVTRVAISGATGAQNGLLNQGDTVLIEVSFSEAVTVGGPQSPKLALDIGGSQVQASYDSGTGSDKLVFKYVVLAGQTDLDGIAIGANAITLPSVPTFGTATIRDATGNDARLDHAAVAANASYGVDTTAPAKPDVKLSTDSGSSDSDGITSSGALSAPNNIETGAKLEYRVQKGSGTFNDWSTSYSAPATDGKADGSYVVEVRQTDKAGNVSESQTISFTLDTSKPVAPNVALSSDSGSSATDGLTSSGALSAPINAETDAKLEYRVQKGGGIFGDWSTSYTEPATDGKADDAYQVEVRQTDKAGNVSEVQTLSYTLDTSAPVIVSTTPQDDANNVGPSSVFKLTFDEAVALGTGQIRLVDDGGGSAGSTVATIDISDVTKVTLSGKTISIDPGIKLELNHGYYIEIDPGAVTDLAGNAHAGIADEVTWNFRVPDPAISLAAVAGDNWVNAAENAQTVTLSGTLSSSVGASVLTAFAAKDFTVTLKPAGGGTDVSATITGYDSATGAWTATVAANTLVDGKQYSIDVSANNGSLSTSTTGSVQVDTSVVAPGLALAADTGSSASDGITQDGSVKVSGLEAGASWQYSTDSGQTWTQGSGSSFTLAEGEHDANSVQVRQTDAAGNTSQVGQNGSALTVDKTAPTVTIESDLSELHADESALVYFTLDETGTDFSESSIQVTGGKLSDFTEIGDGEYGAFFTPDADSTTAATIQVLDKAFSDLAGNRNADGSEADNLVTLTVDTVRPKVQSLVIDGDTHLLLTFDRKLDATNSIEPTYFDIRLDGVSVAIKAISVRDQVLDLVLMEPVNTGDLSFSYNDPEGNNQPSIQSESGNDAESFMLGTVADGYVKGAQIYIDVNGNGLADAAELQKGLVTSSTGSFMLPKSAPAGTIIAVGGTNLDTGLPQTTPLKAPAGSRTINPLTTLVQSVIEQAALESKTLTAAEASDLVSAALGLTLPTGKTLTSYDPLAATDGNALAAQKVAARLGTHAALVALDQPGTGDDVAQAGWAYDQLAQQVLHPTATLNLGSASLWEGKGLQPQTIAKIQGLNTDIGNATSLSDISVIQSRLPDNTTPTIAISSDKTRLADGQSATITFTLSESSKDFTADDVVVSGGSLSGFTGSGNSYSATLTPTAGGSTPVTLSVASAKFNDLAYNPNQDGADANNKLTIEVGNALPVIELSAIAAGTGGFVLNGGASGDNSGYSVSGAGDVNGDGLADLIVGAYGASSNAGRSYVVFGRTDGTALELSALASSQGFVINGPAAGVYSGWSVSSAGDFNGDGLADLVVGAPFTGGYAGRSYVLFGRTAGATVNLVALQSSQGLWINGQGSGDSSGYSVSSAGDVNGDGLTDLIVGATGSNSLAGGSYVVFGRTAGGSLDLSAVVAGSGGFVIVGQCAGMDDGSSSLIGGDKSGNSVASAGDVNGDGLADLIVGARNADWNNGRSYVVFGRTAITAVKLSALTASQGFAINAQSAYDQSGWSVSGAGDVNGDGLADLVVGAVNANGLAGRSYVVFSSTAGTTVDLSAVAAGSGGFVINGQCARDQSGASVSSAGDINGDGLADLILGVSGSDPAAGTNAGRSYVVFGRTAGTAIDLSAVAAGSGGFVINGQCAGDGSGVSVSGAGDVNGDGLADLIVGASDANQGAGRSYVIFGATDGAFSQTAVDQLGTSGADQMSDGGQAKTLVAGAGNDSLTATAASVLQGGAGDDSFTIGAGMITALQSKLGSGGNDAQLARIDGGSGLDTVAFSGTGLTLDLTQIANQAAGESEIGSRLTNIERIDLSGGNTLKLTPTDLFDLAGANSYNSAKGWQGLEASVARHQLLVDGGQADTLVASGTWRELADVIHGGQTYKRLVQGNAELLVDADVKLQLTLAAKPIELSAVAAGMGGFVINGVSSSDHSGYSVSSAGDVNGDGLADLIVGAYQADPSSDRANAGSSYVVFGRSSTDAIELSAVAAGSGGFVINGDSNGDGSGVSVSGAGDVNGDGLADLIVGAFRADPNSRSNAGRSYVVYGRSDTGTVELSALGANGFVINGGASDDNSGCTVSSAGDVNGDGLADLIVGAYFADPNSCYNAGSSYVVYGRSGTGSVELSAVAAGKGGFVINGGASLDNSGISVSSAGDVNGDGLADLIVGASYSDPAGGYEAGRSYVVYGRSSTGVVELSALGVNGFVINGQWTYDLSGCSVSGAGDINGDGLADLIVGAYYADPNSCSNAGSSYVVYGRSSAGVVDLSAVAAGDGGFVINGGTQSDYSGWSVSGAGDVNGDGLADLIVGAHEADPNGSRQAGSSYVIFGATSGAFSQTGVDWLGTASDDSQGDGGVAKTLVAGAGNDSLTATAASVLYGGAGNDQFTIGAGMITALQSKLGSGGNDGQLARIDGGSGLDTVAFSGTGLTLDLTQIANQAAGNPDGGSRLASIERVDLTGGNTLKLTASDIHDLAGMNSFNGRNGWTGLADAVARHQLLVEGGAGDKLSASGSWAELAGVEHGGQTYKRLVQGNAELLVDADVTLDLTIAPGITGIAFGTAPVTQNGLFKKYDLLSFEVTFSEAMFLGGGLATQLALDIGGTTVQANYDSGSGTDKWVFKYAVAAGLTDLDGISIGANAVSRPAGFPSMPSGTVRNASGVDAVFINDPVPANPGWRVDSLAPVAPDATLTAAEDDGGATVAPTNIEAGATLEYRLKKDGSNVTASNDGWSGSYQPPATDGSANGAYTLELRQTDLAGNVSPSTQLEFTVGPKYAPVELSAIAAGSGGFVINGGASLDQSGWSVSSAGDVNGDGLADLIVGANQADPSADRLNAGSSYVVFGRSGTGMVELSMVANGVGGFVINGGASSDNSGHSVSSAGDVNGDGLADLIVGAIAADPSGRTEAGSSYVVFGRSGTGAVELSSLGSNGFVINGATMLDNSGYSVSSVGDVNGDGLADLIVGAYRGDPGTTRVNAGCSYVVFGRSGSGAIELSAVANGTGGFVINGDASNDNSGCSVSGAGDINGDGLADLIVGAFQGDPGTNRDNAGCGYVVFGRSDTSAVELSAVEGGTGGFVINGQCYMDFSGSSVSSAGDVNGDGLADLIVGAFQGDPGTNRGNAGCSYVVFGCSGTGAVELSAVANGTGGFVINGGAFNDLSGYSVSSAGDVNGDGLADLIVGAPYGDVTSRTDAGRSYVVFGRSGSGAIELSAVAAGSGGFVINGQCADDDSGYSVSGAGDVNGDGLADLIVGVPYGDLTGRTNAGLSYVIFGATDGGFAWTAVDQLGGSGVDVMNDGGVAKTLVAGAGDDSLTATAASVLQGGAGNDSLTIGAAMISALESPLGSGGNFDRLARLDGGGGLDTIALSGADLTLDLTKIANQAGGDPEIGSRLSSIERIDLSGSGNNQLCLSAADVRDLAGMNLYNSGNGWTGLAASVPMHQLRIDGDSGDSLVGQGYWAPVAQTASYQGQTYQVYNSVDGTAQLLINQAVTAQLPFPTVELSAVAAKTGGFVINGQGACDFSGYSVSSAGDVNGDGLADLIIGARTSDPTNRTDAGRSYVVFGRTGNDAVDLSAVAAGSGGFVINGGTANDWSGASVSGAGDVNGDGLADLIVGAMGGDPGNRTDAGRSYVIFGRTATTTVELSALAAGGFVMNGQGACDQSGISVSSAGDVNGDGLADLIVGARVSDPTNRTDAGRSYVVFGRTGSGAVELSAVAAGTGGFVINGQGGSDLSGTSVSSAGDINGDGLADLIVGAPYGDPTAERSDAGRSYVIFGRTGQTAVELSALSAGGFVINGECANDRIGMTVSGAGDVNGDGLSDLVVGSAAADGYAGRSYVVFGRTGATPIELSSVALGTGGFVIKGQCAGDSSGASVSGAGDINGDGLADLIVGAYNSASGAGSSYVVYGKSTGTSLDLSAVAAGQGGFVINGQCAGDLSGHSVSSAGDVNGDGLADLIVGAGWSDPTAGTNAGRSYVIFGSTGGAFSRTAVDWFGTSGDDVKSDDGVARTLVAGAGNDSLTATAASVLYGGAGNDTFTINDKMITALQKPLGSGDNVDQLARIDGGAGVDKIVLQGASLTFDLTQIPQSAMNPEGVSRLSGIEAIDITGSGDNTLKLTAKDVLDMTGAVDVVSTAKTGRRMLVVTGNAGDKLDLADVSGTTDGWTRELGLFWVPIEKELNTVKYQIWHSDTTNATVLVQKDMTVI